MWFDPDVVEAIRDAFPEWMAFCFAALSYLGSVWFVAPTAVLAFWFWDRHRFAPWFAIVVGCYAVMDLLKGLFVTPRPGVGPAVSPDALPTVLAYAYVPVAEVESTAFPSGHAFAATVVWTMLALESNVWTRRRRLIGAAALVSLIAFARVGIGLHYPLDVIGGVAAGVGYLAVTLSLRSRLADRRNPRVATSALFAASAGFCALALGVATRPNAAALLGCSVGALLVWHRATPPREPWPVTISVLARVGPGLAAFAGVALAVLVVDSVVVWVLVGFVGGVTVLGLPRLVDGTTAPRTRAESPG